MNSELQLLIDRLAKVMDAGQFSVGLSICKDILKTDPDNIDALYGRAFALRKLDRFEDATQAVTTGLRVHQVDPRLLNERALISYHQGDWKNALDAFRETLQVDSKNEKALEWTVDCNRMLRDFGAAQAEVDKALAKLPKNEMALEYTVDCNRMLRDFGAAQAEVDKALAKLPKNPALLNQRAFISYDQGDWKKALNGLQETLQVDSKNKKALECTVDCNRMLRDFGAAQAEVDKALAKLPKNPALLNQRAFISYDQGDWTKALNGLQETLQVDSKNKKALEFTVVCNRMLRDFGAAQAEVDKALAKLPKNPALLNQRAFISYDQGDWTKALNGLQETLQVDSKNEKALEATVVCNRMLRDFGAAQAEVDKALAKLPKNPALLNQRASISYDQGDWKNALDAFRETLQVDSKNEMARAYLITCYKRLGDAEAVKQAMQDAVKTLPNSAQVHYRCGLTHLEDRNFAEAEKALTAAVMSNRDWYEPLFELAGVLTRIGRQREAFSQVEELKTKFPIDARIREALGFMHITANDLTSARREFNAILTFDPRSEMAKNGLGAVMYNSNRFREAAEIFQDLAAQNPHELVFRTNQARALSRMTDETDVEKAKEICEDVLRVDHVNSAALTHLGVIHYKLGSWNESEECLRRAIELSAADGPYRDLGALYIKQGRYDEAETQLKIAMQINKLDTRAYIEMGSLFFELDRKSEAIRMLRRAVATDRHSAEAVQALANGLIKVNESSEAEQQLRNGIKVLNPRDCFGIHLSLARVLIQLGSKANDTILLEEALQQASKAVKLEPNNPDGYFELGMAHNAVKSPARALRNFKKCKELALDHLEAERNIERLNKLLTGERAAKRSDIAGVAISSVAFLLLLVLWGLYLLQPIHASPAAKSRVASILEQVANKSDSKIGKAPEPMPEPQIAKSEPAKSEPAKSEPVPSYEPRIDKTMLLAFTPMLLGLIVIGAILPWVGRLKFAGMEAELQQARVSIGAGPSGQTGSDAPEGAVTLRTSGGSSIDTGPR